MPEEIKQDVVLKTQKYLGKYVKKPPLSEKLLKKPPFRFLHDIIKTVIKETGFLKGLFTEEELNSENVKEKEAKVAFLTKLIDAVKVITNTDLAVRPSKIVAGLEPTETNILLQTIGKAIEKKIDSSEYVKQFQSGDILGKDKNRKSKKPSDKNEKVKKTSKIVIDNEEKSRVPKVKDKQSNNETPKSTDRDKSKPKRTSKESKGKPASDDGKTKSKEKPKKTKEKSKDVTTKEKASKESTEIPTTTAEIMSTVEINEKQNLSDTVDSSVPENVVTLKPEEEFIKTIIPQTTETTDSNLTEGIEPRKRSASASRPKSARPKSGDLKEKTIKDELKEPKTIQNRPKSSLRPPSVRPSSARPGAPRLRPDSALPIKEIVPMGKINVIVESFDKDGDEEETVIIQSNSEAAEEHVENTVEVSGTNQGHLVEQILEQINESDVKVNATKNEDDWQKDVFQGKDATTKETNNLKSLIQTLTKTANPLGKLLSYLHEDIDAMQAELEMWTNTKRQLFGEIAKQKKISLEMNKPMISQLEHLNQEITKMEEEIASTRSNILRNDLKIKELLAK
ncbi:TRAF3-interacting protein 1 [Tribolium madens]|uniref:TRAF3-interacting protein 1 n=1 Tax=Tribolium madens TaxID=41895 RepID=UPI001CF76225|nr:TRAF3-interacting protein 1 [Tribolium madens]